MPVVTVSKEFASESEDFARSLSDRLGYSILDKQIVAAAAQELNLSETEALSFQKERESRLLRLIDRYTSTVVQRIVDRSYGRLDDQAYHQVTVNLVKKVAEEGNVIIFGWGAQCILEDHPDALHLRLVKRIEDRVRWLRTHFDMDERSARELIDREERESATYIEHYFNRSWDDAHLYHLVLNLSKIPLQAAVDLVAGWVEAHPHPSGT
ncbi:AAA family ATPase [Desulfoglaeba alkanexedens]|jgi:cytidylate kinase|uniref:Cytidylate kinase-like family protein n=1 Tax=Desulfoglaeba alkanexedens ALDC TaxID=980445 RepID=A0A4V1ERX0_9BACT|nr:cytidylate kinase-like family protein [Desulfoglaeba alkanexedens]QCQ23111.1 cytidylate kinase-like family protein [Desulfoglaeba alkanexedens ALDC]